MTTSKIEIIGGFSITYGVIGDLTTPDERGGYSGNASLLYGLEPRKTAARGAWTDGCTVSILLSVWLP